MSQLVRVEDVQHEEALFFIPVVSGALLGGFGRWCLRQVMKPSDHRTWGAE